jgi:hypothetical protein
MINARTKGKRYEQQIANLWMSLFGGHVERTSYASKKLDDMGVDLTNTDPFLIQCKAVEQSINVHDILDRMPNSELWNVVLHKRNNRGTVVSLRLDDFLELVEAMKANGII